MNENYSAFYIAIVSERPFTPEQAFKAYEHGRIERKPGNYTKKPGRKALDVDLDQIRTLRSQGLAWEKIAAIMKISARTLRKKGVDV